VKNWLDKLNYFKFFYSSQNFYEREAINCILPSSVSYLIVFSAWPLPSLRRNILLN